MMAISTAGTELFRTTSIKREDLEQAVDWRLLTRQKPSTHRTWSGTYGLGTQALPWPSQGDVALYDSRALGEEMITVYPSRYTQPGSIEGGWPEAGPVCMREFGFERERLAHGLVNCETVLAGSISLNEGWKEESHRAITDNNMTAQALHGEESIAEIAQPRNNIATSC